MKKSTIKFCVMLFAFCISAIHLQAMDEWDGVTIAKGFYSGTGTKANPYKIFTASQFLYFIQQTKDGNTFEGQYIELCNDIAFSNEAISGGNFYGDFDGNDHTIQVNQYWKNRDDWYSWRIFNLYGSMHDVQFVRANGVMSIYTGGILYNCRFEFPNGYHGYWTVYLEGGTIANCVSNSAYFQNTSKYGGAMGLVYGYESSSHCSNCYFPITSYSYGGTLAKNYYGVVESCGEEAGNDWVLSHTERAYKSWPLTFNPTYPDYNVTITFVDEYGLVSYDAKTYLANSTIGELPIPNVDNIFLGWKCNGTYVQSTDVITHDMVLYADWKHEIKAQPTIYEPSVSCNDKEHATYQWYYQKKMPLLYEDLSSGSSKVEITIPEDNLVLSFDFIAYGHTASGYSGDDEEAWICVDGNEIVYVWDPESGSYSCVLSAGTHTITRRRSSLSNICISYPTETLADETSSTLSKQTIMGKPGAYFCLVTYSNNGEELISDYVNYEKLLTIDNVTYVVNEDSTATVLWVADMAVDIFIPETVNSNDVDYPVTSISSNAFVDCTSLASIRCKTQDVPTLLGGTTFEGLNGESITSNATLYVPNDCAPVYSVAEGWKDFSKIIEPNVDLVDGQTFSNIEHEVMEKITYTRTLPNLYWNALYVPFELPYDVISDRYDVAYINDVNGYDTDDNGEIDDLAMEIIKIKGGTLKANHPYLIKAKTEADKDVNITVENTTLYAAEENAVDCSSVYQNYVIKGTYTKKTAEELAGKLAISTSGAWQPLAEGTALNPFRLYLSIENRDNSPLKVEPAAMSRMRIVERGETTGIEEVVPSQQREDVIFDLSGRRVKQPVKGGVYIVNGKKRIL